MLRPVPKPTATASKRDRAIARAVERATKQREKQRQRLAEARTVAKAVQTALRAQDLAGRQPVRSKRPTPRKGAVVDEGLRAFIRRQPCCICGATPVDACHVRTKRNHGDLENLVPLDRKHHMEQHRIGIHSFEEKYVIDLSVVAKLLDGEYRESLCSKNS